MSTADNDLSPKVRLAQWGRRLAVRWPGCRCCCQPGLDRPLGIWADEASVELDPAAADLDQRIVVGISLSSLAELTARAASAVTKPTHAPNIDPNRKKVAQITEQPCST